MNDLEDSKTLSLGDVEAEPSAAPVDIEPGVLIGETYRIVRLLGEGSMGEVFLGHDERLDREVAIKVLRPDALERPERRAQFELEARAMARVRHPNVVEVHAFGDHRGKPYFVMECVEGGNLAHWRSRHQGPLDVDEVLGIMDPLCRGVQALHEAGAVHGDLKPGNILLGPAGRVAVADLGLVRGLGTIPASPDRIEGTPGYMAPEVITGEIESELASRIDVYALGIIAFELLTGRRPFDAPAASGMLLAHVYDRPRKVSELRPEISTAFDQVIHRALAKKPEHRLPSARVLRQGLDRARSASNEHRRPVRVLLVDDDPDQRQLLRYWLEESSPSVRVYEAEDGRQALDLAVAEQLDVALVDLHMPVMDGTTLTAKLRQLPEQSELPIVVCTGVGGAPDWRVLKELGASGFLVKPVDREQMLSMTFRLAQKASESTGVDRRATPAV